ncbi:Cell division control protein 42-like [Oopsacas minuta]|uniref:Cell division control protein 42-like n=1 Tax=Oopsacas minuta TaxID=111878 RepID=A0AAV7KH43_9METZ|nr:Cell division control protein 42-like [Oopsacas minuta]
MQVSCNSIREHTQVKRGSQSISIKPRSSTHRETTHAYRESITQSCDDYFTRNKSVSIRRPKPKFSHSENRNIIFVGEEYSGRTSLMDRVEQKFKLSESEKECYHWEENGTACSKLVSESQNLILLDMERQTNYDKRLKDFYSNMDMFVICYDLSDENGFEQACNKWIRNIKEHHPRNSFIVVGCKSDIDYKTKHLVTVSPRGKKSSKVESVESIALELGASAYIECSSWLITNIDKVYEAATGVILPSKLSPDPIRRKMNIRRTKSLVVSLRSSFRKK